MKTRMIDEQFEVDENNVLIKYHNKEEITDIVIPDDITKIGEKAFKICTNLTSIIIPTSVTEIGEYAFARCENLTGITIPDSVTKIGMHSFSNCKSLTMLNPRYQATCLST